MAGNLSRWENLVAEERFNTESLAAQTSGNKSLRKAIRLAQKKNRK